MNDWEKQMATSSRWQDREEIAKKTWNQDLLDWLSRDLDKRVRLAVIIHSHARMETIHAMAQDPDTEVRMWVAERATDHGTLAILAKDQSADVRSAVASHWSLPRDIIEILASDPRSAIRSEIARHRDTPADVLARLATDPSDGVRESVAMSTDDADMLAKLASDSDYGVRQACACNPSTPADTLAALAYDPESGIRSCAIDTLRRLAKRSRSD